VFGAVGDGEGAFWGAALAAEEEQQRVLGEAEETVALDPECSSSRSLLDLHLIQSGLPTTLLWRGTGIGGGFQQWGRGWGGGGGCCLWSSCC